VMFAAAAASGICSYCSSCICATIAMHVGTGAMCGDLIQT
jgi:hypothetical protein